jgi:opacity protein-like surface antigen
MKFIRLAFLFAISSLVSYGQGQNKPQTKRFFYHSHGISFQKFENLNKRISNNPQFEQAKNSIGTLEFGMFAERNKLITIYSINAGSSLSGDREKKSASVNFTGLSADAGYSLIKNTRVSLYPLVGVGYETFKVKYNKDVSSVPFDSVFQSNNFQQRVESLVINNSFFVYRFGAGMFITSRKHFQNSIGFQLGYTGSFSEDEWKINKSQTLLNSPKDNLSRLSASVLIRYQFKKIK